MKIDSNMKLILNCLLVNFVLFGVACGQGVLAEDLNKQYFLELLHDGYIVEYKGREFVTGFYYDRKTCVYGVAPNDISKKRIDSIYKLMVKKFVALHTPVYVSKIKECPASSNFFILLHDDLYDRETKLKELNKIEDFLGREMSKNIKLAKGLASTYRRYGRGGFVFIEITQLTKYLDNHIYKSLLNSLIIEELMHGISGGNDLNIKIQRMSLLQEPHISQLPYFDNYLLQRIGSKWHINFYKKMQKAKPSGFCSFDLWFLILADMAREKKIILYAEYVKLFNKNVEKIKKDTLIIENNSAYKDLFDPRCSGKNTGINSKIGIE